jgi:hypothetical protein
MALKPDFLVSGSEPDVSCLPGSSTFQCDAVDVCARVVVIEHSSHATRCDALAMREVASDTAAIREGAIIPSTIRADSNDRLGVAAKPSCRRRT